MDTGTGGSLITGGLLISLGLAILYSLKNLPNLIWKKIQTRFIYKVTIYDYDDLYYVLEQWLYKNHANKYRDTEAGYSIFSAGMYPETRSSEDKTVKLSFKQGIDFFVVPHEGKKLIFSKSKEKMEAAATLRSLFCHSFTIKGFRAKAQIESLLQQITDEYNKSMEDNRLMIYAFFYGSWSLINKRSVKTIDNIILDENIKVDIITNLDNFMGRKKWYEDNNIPYKMNFLFHGPPGTGKTTLAFSVAARLKKNVYILNLNSVFSDEQLISAVKNVPDGAVLLIEDIDAAFSYRNESKETKLSFSCLLNCLDGALCREGIVTIITTNHPDKLDPALIRAGRIDKPFEIGNAKCKQVNEYLKLFYLKDFCLDEELDIPISTVQEACIQNMENPEGAISKILKYDNTINSRSIASPDFVGQAE